MDLGSGESPGEDQVLVAGPMLDLAKCLRHLTGEKEQKSLSRAVSPIAQELLCNGCKL